MTMGNFEGNNSSGDEFFDASGDEERGDEEEEVVDHDSDCSKSAERNSDVPSDVSSSDDEDDEDLLQEEEKESGYYAKEGNWTFLQMNCPSLFEDLTQEHIKDGNSFFTHRSFVKGVLKAIGCWEITNRISAIRDDSVFCCTVEKYEEPLGPVGAIPVVGSQILMVPVKEFPFVDDSMRKNKITKTPIRLLLHPANKLKNAFRLLVKTGDLVVIWGGLRCTLEDETIITLNPWVCPDVIVVSLSLKKIVEKSQVVRRVLKIAELLRLENEIIKCSELTHSSSFIRIEQGQKLDRKSLNVLAALMKTEENEPEQVEMDSQENDKEDESALV